MSSIAPLQITYSFAANRRSAIDRVDSVKLDTVLRQMSDKLNEVIAALDETLRDDNTLDDGAVQPRHLHEETLREISAMVAQAVAS